MLRALPLRDRRGLCWLMSQETSLEVLVYVIMLAVPGSISEGDAFGR